MFKGRFIIDSLGLLDSVKLKQIIQDLEEKQWSQVDLLFTKELSEDLHQDILNLDKENCFIPANTGSGKNLLRNGAVRGDHIFWLNEKLPGFHQCQNNIFSVLKLLKTNFNQKFYLNIRNLEFHYALYPAGAHYDKHLDQHKGQNQRTITFVHYLNPLWKISDGGRLLIYDPENPEKVLLTVEPLFGRTILFFSDVFQHEVEVSSQKRMSFTGWFRND